MHAVSIRDVGQDMVHSYDSTYSNYVEVNDEKDPILEKHLREQLREDEKERMLERKKRKEQEQRRKREIIELVSKPPQAAQSASSLPFVLEDLEDLEAQPIVSTSRREGSLSGWLEDGAEEHNQDLPVSYSSRH